MSDQLALMAHEGTASGAVVSPCGRYRYRLWRRVVSHHAHHVKDRIALFVMLNPSTADGLLDDPTIRRCVGFAAREGCGWLHVVNLYAYRATNPAELALAADPVGPEAGAALGAALREAVESGGLVIAAWGAHSAPRTIDLAARFSVLADVYNAQLHCLGTTKNGSPRHPLYVRADAPLEVWS